MSDAVYQVVSPVMGTFYRAPNPEAPPFVKLGQTVNAGDVVCVIESMKIFTELRTEKGGKVQAILLENEDMVMKNQAVIEIALAE